MPKDSHCRVVLALRILSPLLEHLVCRFGEHGLRVSSLLLVAIHMLQCFRISLGRQYRVAGSDVVVEVLLHRLSLVLGIAVHTRNLLAIHSHHLVELDALYLSQRTADPSFYLPYEVEILECSRTSGVKVECDHIGDVRAERSCLNQFSVLGLLGTLVRTLRNHSVHQFVGSDSCGKRLEYLDYPLVRFCISKIVLLPSRHCHDRKSEVINASTSLNRCLVSESLLQFGILV